MDIYFIGFENIHFFDFFDFIYDNGWPLISIVCSINIARSPSLVSVEFPPDLLLKLPNADAILARNGANTRILFLLHPAGEGGNFPNNIPLIAL